MVYIKKMVVSGFKSFAKKTEIIFDKEVNVILGPNGSGKSNIADALCFVLGRLSIKSMRAAKAKNLLFMGSKYHKPSKEAYVELVFDNSDKAFSIDKNEIFLTRIVRVNGQSIYKINGETKTRAEIIEMLAQAGIDPHGFNMILQGQIQSIVRMHPEERRKIIEEVAGISIYESRKEKALHELEKTEEKLKEIGAILRERTGYLRNLDQERAQALKFKDLELIVKRCKASIISRNLHEKQKELQAIEKSIHEKSAQKDKIKSSSEKIIAEIESLTEKINLINKNIQHATGLQQETLNEQIANLKAELEGLKVRKENYENRKSEIERRISEVQRSIPELESEIQNLKKESPLMARKSQELKKKKEEFSQIEDERSKLLSAKTELVSLREIARDKERQGARLNAESESLLKQIEASYSDLNYKSEEACSKSISLLIKDINEKEKSIIIFQQDELKNEKIISVIESEIERYNKIKNNVDKLDICPLCQSKITADHRNHVFEDVELKIKSQSESFDNIKNELNQIKDKKNNLSLNVKSMKEKIKSAEDELLKHRTAKDRKEQLKRIVENEKIIKEDLTKLNERIKNLENKTADLSKVQEKYDSKILEIEEISSRTEEDLDTSLLYKEREIENIRNVIKRSKKDLEDVINFIEGIVQSIDLKSKDLEKKDQQEKELSEKFKKMFEDRDKMQKDMQEKNINLSEIQSNIRQIEDQINYLKIGKAKIDAEREAIQMELSEYHGIELIQASLSVIEERLKKAQESLMQIGSINMRALEVYDSVKKEYDIVQEKVNTLDKEKQDILSIISEIDHKKIRSFMKTFKAMNSLFSENFSRLSSKGLAFLEVDNKEDIFAGGISIVVKLAKGKYFDVTSLSGGEQTLVALSLLFAIQEYKPYHFYIFDEIDAALDKRNSERLAGLLKQYMKSGQYIVITHNDAIILNSNVLYGVSMHDGISKVLSLKLGDNKINKDESSNKEEASSQDK